MFALTIKQFEWEINEQQQQFLAMLEGKARKGLFF